MTKSTQRLKQVFDLLKQSNLKLVTAESCTGGLLAKQITDLAGSSSIFDRGYVTYSNQSKQEMLGVTHDSLIKFGAVSEQVVEEMAKGALKHSKADIAIAISGVAGPEGGSEEKPVGTVCFGLKRKNGISIVKTTQFNGDRKKVRNKAVKYALNQIKKISKEK